MWICPKCATHVLQDDLRRCPRCNSTRSWAISPGLNDELIQDDKDSNWLWERPKRLRLWELERSLVFGKSFKITFVIVWVASLLTVFLNGEKADQDEPFISRFLIYPFATAFGCALIVNLLAIIGLVLYGMIRPRPAKIPEDNDSSMKPDFRHPTSNSQPGGSNEDIQTNKRQGKTDIQL